MGLGAVRCELALLNDLDEEVAEYLVSCLADAAADAGAPLDGGGVLEVVEPFVDGLGLDDAEVAALGSRIAALMSAPDESTQQPPTQRPSAPHQEAQSAQDQRLAKLAAAPDAAAATPAPEPEAEPEPAHEPEPEAAEEDPQLAFLRESFPSLSGQDIRQVLRQNRGQVDDRAFELLLQRQAAKAAKAEAPQQQGAVSGGADAGAKGTLSDAGKREAVKRRRALLERYENSAAAGSAGGRRKNATGSVKTVHGRLPTKAEAARQKAAEQRSKVRYRDGEVVTRTGEKYTAVKPTKEEEEREKALKAATSVNLAYKSSKGRRQQGR
jgi:hypothetical protein